MRSIQSHHPANPCRRSLLTAFEALRETWRVQNPKERSIRWAWINEAAVYCSSVNLLLHNSEKNSIRRVVTDVLCGGIFLWRDTGLSCSNLGWVGLTSSNGDLLHLCSRGLVVLNALTWTWTISLKTVK